MLQAVCTTYQCDVGIIWQMDTSYIDCNQNIQIAMWLSWAPNQACMICSTCSCSIVPMQADPHCSTMMLDSVSSILSTNSQRQGCSSSGDQVVTLMPAAWQSVLPSGCKCQVHGNHAMLLQSEQITQTHNEMFAATLMLTPTAYCLTL